MFLAYSNKPELVGATIESAVKELNILYPNIVTWKALDIAGNFIIQKIKSTILEKEIFVADITTLNFNVTYEIGYAIGIGKSIILVKNKSINEGDVSIREVGIFDTIGYVEYENTNELIDILKSPNTHKLNSNNDRINTKAPVYLLETKYKTDYSSRITARIKKARLTYRSFDPNESPRLSAHDAIQQVAQSFGVVIQLLSEDTKDFMIHNIRAAFIAGLTHGMDKVTTILQYGETPIPIDYRDFANIYYVPDDINKHIAEFANKIVEAFQENNTFQENSETSYLQDLDLGASSAENEMRTLRSYYLKTDSYLKASRGEAQLIVGRKGSGKSAIFLQIRDKERGRSKNVVIDLKPDGYKLIKFKEIILDYMEEGTFQHTITAFWEYLLLLEICHKILQNDKKRYINQYELYEPYRELQKIYSGEDYITDGDFSERMAKLMEKITVNYKAKYGNKEKVRLSIPEITGMLYNSNIKSLRNSIIKYLKLKKKVWILFDNIDKGWPSTGLKQEDFLIIRTLIDASRKIQRYLSKGSIDLYSLIFLRNDVYELLIEQTSDRQKESKVLLDWVDPDLLRKMIQLRIQSNIDEDERSFDDLWRNICVSHYNGEETSQYLIERSLMRPRFLINLINQCKSFAINLNHTKIESDDIEKGLSAFSVDLQTDISYEIRDIIPEAKDILYGFITSKKDISNDTLNQIIGNSLSNKELILKIVDLLLWYGFLGVKINNQESKYIYDLNYNMQLLKGLIQKKKNEVIYTIHPGFRPSLMIK